MKKRVYEIAKEFNLQYKDLIKKFEEIGVTVKSHNSAVEEKDVEALKQLLEKERSKTAVKPKTILRKRKETTVETPVAQAPPQPVQIIEETKQPSEEKKEQKEQISTHEQVTESPATPDNQPTATISPSPEEKAIVTEEETHARAIEIEQTHREEGIGAQQPQQEPIPTVVQGEESGISLETRQTQTPEKQEMQPVKEEQEDKQAKKALRPPIELIPPEKGKGKIKSEKGGAFIKRKFLSKMKTNIAEEIDLLHDSAEEEPVVENIEYYRKKAQPPHKQRHDKPAQKDFKPQVVQQKKTIRIEDKITVSKLSQLAGVKASEIIKRLITLGIMAGMNDVIDADTASLVIKDIGFDVTVKQEESIEERIEKEVDPPEKLKPRPPVITVMGHVDHGKTTLLDAIRATKVAEGEAGGITQHIGAYKITIDNRVVVFLDTPGHEAFTAMRARGAKVTDIVVLVVAADDGVMPQTIEAIDHAKAAGVPIVVAINKIDKPEAQPQRVMQQLSDYGLVPEQWGGNTLYAQISAKKKTGINELLELILLQAEMLELKANPDKNAKATIIETSMKKGFGVVATAIVKEGTLKRGDYIVYGTNYNKVKTLLDDNGNVIQSAGPSIPVEIIGFESIPEVGDVILAVNDEDTAMKIIEQRRARQQVSEPVKKAKISLEDIYRKIEEGSIKELPILLKCDVMGSLGAIKDALENLSGEEVKINIIHAGIGGITENDVMLAIASNSIIIGFNVRPDTRATQLANTHNVQIKTYNIIYDLIDDVKKALSGLLKPVTKELVIGRAKVLETFKISKVGVIAGSIVLDGKVERGANVRVIRDGVVVYDSKIGSLRRFKDDVKEVDKGFECGIGIEKFNDIKKNDELEVYRIVKEGTAS
ncbi:MAG: translation initiation factor IF-2 [bacterium]